MREWFEGLAGQQYASAILWTLAALVGLVIILIIVRLVRSMTGGTFVAGGRNRKTRLAVMDATAVDSNRRLVLVRRDDVEHLILIGGPTDVVVERDIRLGQQRRPPAPTDDRSELPPRPRATEPAQVRPAPPPQPPQPQQRAPERIAPQPAPAPRPVQREPAPPPRPAPQPAQRPAQALQQSTAVVLARTPPQRLAPPPPRPDELDDELLHELEESFEPPRQQPPAQPQRKPELSLDDEMTKLLGELSSQKR